MTTIAFDTTMHQEDAPAGGTGVLAALRGVMAGLAARRQLALHHRATLDLDNHLRADIGLPEVTELPQLRAGLVVSW